jgi:hypothetical protein
LVLLALVAGVFLLVVLVLTWPTLGRRNPDELVPHRPPIPAWRALPAIPLVLALALGLIFAIAVLHGGQIHPRAVGGGLRVPSAPALPHLRTAAPGFGLSPAPIIAGVASVLLLACVGAAVALGRRRRFATPARADGRRAVASAIDESLADLESWADARAAVIRAYLRMEVVLSQADLRRRASEAPREYLARAARLLGSDAAAAAERLTDVFEEARFSPHEIRESVRDDALAALTQLRAHVGAEA